MIDVQISIKCNICGETVYAGAKSKRQSWYAEDVVNAFVATHRDCSVLSGHRSLDDSRETPEVLPPVLPRPDPTEQKWDTTNAKSRLQGGIS